MLLDDLHVDWGVNRWVLLERGDRSVQRQVSKPTELAVAIREVAGGSWEDALEEAEALWRKRPSDAGAQLAHPRQSLVGATGLSTRAVSSAIAIFIAIWIVVILSLTH